MKKREDIPSGRGAEDLLGQMNPEEMQRARRRFVAWVRWYMDWHADEVPSEAALARKLGITKTAVNYLLARDSTRFPSFETLLSARALIGMSLDAMLFSDPPAARPPRP